MKEKIKVKKFNIKWQKKDYEILIPYFPINSLWVACLETEDGNGIIGTLEGTEAFSVILEIASRNPFSILYIPIHSFQIPDVNQIMQAVTFDKEGLFDIVITSTKVQLKRKDWKQIRYKIRKSKFENIELSYHFDLHETVEYYDQKNIIKGALNDVQCGTFFIVYPQPFLQYSSRRFHRWLEKLKSTENYSLKYDDRYGEITVYSFYTDVWTFILEQPSFDNPKKLTCGFYVDCMDIKTMEKFLKRKINFLDWKEVKTINL